MRITFICIFLIFHAFTAKGGDLFGKVGSLTEEKVLKAMSSVSERGSLTEKDIQRADTGLNSMILRKLKHVQQKSREYKRLQDEVKENHQLVSSFIRRSNTLQSSIKHAHPFFTSAQKEKEVGFDDFRQRLLGYNNRAQISGSLSPFTIHWQIIGLKERVITLLNEDEKKFNMAWAKLTTFFAKVDGYIRHLIQSGDLRKIECTCRNGDYEKVKVKATAHHLVFVNVFKNLPSGVIAQAEKCSESDFAGALKISAERLVRYLSIDDLKQEYAFFTTVIHELFHLLGFHPRFAYPRDKTTASRLDTLIMNYFVSSGEHHSNDQYFPHDIMVPRANGDHPWELVVTTFTLRHLELVNDKIVINAQYMSNDTFFNHLRDIDDFIQYVCDPEDEGKPRFDIYCPAAATSSTSMCLKNRLATTRCTGKKYSNGCGVKKIEKHCIWSHTGRQNINSIIQHFGLDSRCFDSSNKGALCLKFEISNNELYIYYDTERKKCDAANPELTFKGGIKVNCPKLDVFTNHVRLTHCPGNCRGNGFCVSGRCACFNGFSGNDCTQFNMPHFILFTQ